MNDAGGVSSIGGNSTGTNASAASWISSSIRTSAIET
jgi:hypothetical protein